MYPDVIERRFADALTAWDSAPTDTAEERLTGQVARIAIRIIAGQRDAARAECERLAPTLQAELARQPDSLRLLQQSSWVDVCRGRNAEAIATARRAVALMPLERDAYNYGGNSLVGLAQIAARCGDADAALPAIERLLSVPAGGVMSIERLKLDPVWDPLRNDERFRKLIAGAGQGNQGQ